MQITALPKYSLYQGEGKGSSVCILLEKEIVALISVCTALGVMSPTRAETYSKDFGKGGTFPLLGNVTTVEKSLQATTLFY